MSGPVAVSDGSVPGDWTWSGSPKKNMKMACGGTLEQPMPKYDWKVYIVLSRYLEWKCAWGDKQD